MTNEFSIVKIRDLSEMTSRFVLAIGIFLVVILGVFSAFQGSNTVAEEQEDETVDETLKKRDASSQNPRNF